MSKARHKDHDRRQKFTGAASSPRSRTPLLLLSAAGLILLSVVVLRLSTGSDPTPPSAVPSVAVAGAGADITIPASTLDDGQARFYRYTTAAGRELRLFVMKSADGVVRAAFDACDVCYRERRGYRQDGDAMVCNNCGKAFPSNRINDVQGGCNPAPIERTIANGQVVLRAAALEQGSFYF